ncbi:MAG: polyprenyl synthetase family protein [Aquificae bacterium]|nr:polyprenyl synthetase family protein [Aquificota bacterium]
MEKISLWRERIDKRLKELFLPTYPEDLASAMAYYLFQPGKRIRPIITVAVAEVLGGDEEDAITAGCAVEMIHNYSLIHDDLPAMDNDDLRRGMPTCHKKFGEAIAILAGDALLTYAFEVLSRPKVFKTLSPQEIIRVIHIVSVKSGIEGMVGGQALDIKRSADLYRINLKKTAALFEASFMLGGVVSKREDLIGGLEELGRNFGLLFQITDDILDRDGYFELLGEEEAKDKAGEMYRKVIDGLERVFGSKPASIKFLADKVYNRVREEASSP